MAAAFSAAKLLRPPPAADRPPARSPFLASPSSFAARSHRPSPFHSPSSSTRRAIAAVSDVLKEKKIKPNSVPFPSSSLTFP